MLVGGAHIFIVPGDNALLNAPNLFNSKCVILLDPSKDCASSLLVAHARVTSMDPPMLCFVPWMIIN